MNNSLEIRTTRLKYVLWPLTIVSLLLLCIPSLYVIIWSLKGTSTVGTLGESTFDWYKTIFTSYDWGKSFLYSFLLAISSSLVATTSAVLYFYFSLWYRRAYQTIGYILSIGPLFFPSIVYALALKVTFGPLAAPEWIPLIVGHVVLLVPIQYFLIESSNELIKIEWIFGAATMGATHREILWQIIYPLLKKQIFISFGVGILFSFDEIVLASLIIDSSNATVPKRMWDTINRHMDPTPAVVATIVLFISITTIILFHLRTKRKEE